jgi:hypothetical protein
MSSSNPNEPKPLRVAMWSGPRNISTAMMRSWGNRADTVVIDEPFYAFYLKQTGKAHPGAAEIMRHGETSSQKIVEHLLAPALPPGVAVFYQKQMTHHLLPEVDRSWLGSVANCFLIRDPAEVIASYLKQNGEPALEDLGFVQQLEIFEFVRQANAKTPPVIDANDILRHPENTLRLLCQALGLPFDPAMLSWSRGLRETDGSWARHWYSSVARSTGFARYRKRNPEVPVSMREMEERCRDCYDRLYACRLG